MKRQKKICVLTIAGSDSGAGAGIQSDIKTFYNHRVYGVSVITAVTSQNTRGVQSSYELPPEVILSQICSVFTDFDIKAIKTGMLSSEKVVRVVSKFLKSIGRIPLIIDPVIFSKNNFPLLNKTGIRALKKHLLPSAYLVTPNIPEAELISGIKIKDLKSLELAAKKIFSNGCKNVLIKGGHFRKEIGLKIGIDVLYNGKKFIIFNPPSGSKHFDARFAHGTGCTLSAAITSNIAKGDSLNHSIMKAKQYLIAKYSARFASGSEAIS